jgi:molecular chaperone DnaK
MPLEPDPIRSSIPPIPAVPDIPATQENDLPEMEELDLEDLEFTEDVVIEDDDKEAEIEASASTDLPAVLAMPESPSGDEMASSQALESDLFPSVTPPMEAGRQADDIPLTKPIPGTENDEIIGLPSPEQLSDEMVVPLDFGEIAADEGFALPAATEGAPSALLLDVTPRALGVATAGGFCDTLIDRNAAIPVEQSRLFTTSADNQTEVLINVFQGESRRVEQNTHLGQVVLSEIRPTRRGAIKIRVTFEIDTDGILGVSARNEETRDAQSTRIVLAGGMPEEQIEALVEKYANDQES